MTSLEHGVEYCVLLKSGCDYYGVLAEIIAKYKNIKHGGGKMIIANTKDTDDRLLVSNYYAGEKNVWFSNFEPKSCKLDSIDIELNGKEKEMLNHILNGLQEQVVEHGWYETIYIKCK
jgi:hypothetical protein